MGPSTERIPSPLHQSTFPLAGRYWTSAHPFWYAVAAMSKAARDAKIDLEMAIVCAFDHVIGEKLSGFPNKGAQHEWEDRFYPELFEFLRRATMPELKALLGRFHSNAHETRIPAVGSTF